MKQLYLPLLVCAVLLMCSSTAFSQAPQSTEIKNTAIDGLSVYPNPSYGNTINITSSLGLTKQIKIYDVLGSKILFKVLVGKELNVSSLKAGVYYMDVIENGVSAKVKIVLH